MRLDSFNNFNQPYMARGVAMLDGIAVVISPNVPKFHAANELIYVRAPLLLRLLWRLFGANPDKMIRFKPGKQILEDQALFSTAANKLFVSPLMWEQIKRAANRV